MNTSSVKSTAFEYLESLTKICNKCSEKIVPTIKKVSALAFAILGAFSAFTSPKIFTAFFVVGAFLGVCSYFNNKNISAKSHKHGSSACVDGFLSEISSVKLPATVLIVANFFITLCHVDHHANVYVPVTGLYCGAFFGKNITEWLDPSKIK